MSRTPNNPPDPKSNRGSGSGAGRPSGGGGSSPGGRNPKGADYLSGPGSRPSSPSGPGASRPGSTPPPPNYSSNSAVPPRTQSPAPAPLQPRPRSVPADPAYLGGPAPAPSGGGRGCRRWAVLALVGIIVLALLTLIGGLGSYVAIAAGLPSTDQLVTSNLAQSTKIYDRNGGLLYEVFDPNSVSGGRRTIVPPEQIPNVLKQAMIDTEDPTFYTNPGVDFRSIARAIYYDVLYHSVVSGASTITQQLVRNTLITPEPTFQRKIREAVLAMEVTRRYSKDQILALYLNAIYFGNLSYGIEAASQGYFQKDVSQLDLAEASLLAGLPQSPSIYDPCENPDGALKRQKVVLGLMVDRKHISQEQADAAAAEMDQRLHSDAFAKSCKAPAKLGAPHFVFYILQQLEDQYGQEVVYNGGLQVYTTLDPTIQNIAQEEVTKQMAALKGNNVTDAAVVAVNPQTGEMLAMLGSANFYDKAIAGQVNVATALRQPGSSIKPINYVTALQKGWTPATPILDIVTSFPTGGGPLYTPTDYDGKEHGIVDVRTALANSLNIPAVKTLYFVTVKDMIATAQRMGITSFQDPSKYGLAITLGGAEVRLSELTGAYAVFANGGKLQPVTPYIKIVDGQGRTLLDNSRSRPPAQQAIDPRHAYLITSILSDNNARAMEFGANSPLKTSRPAFAKTGTTNDFKDNLTLGGTPELVIGVWVGNANNSAMKGVTGISGAAPIWNHVLERTYKEDKLYTGIAPHDFPIPQGLVRATVCNESGLLATPLCPANHQHTEIFVAEQAPKQPDNVWVKVKIDKSNGLLANDQCPADQVEEKVFEKMPKDPVLPYEKVVAWANTHGIPQPPQQASPCTSQPTAEPTTSVNEVNITSPQNGETVNGRLRVRGTAAIPDFDHYIVELGQGDQWVQIGDGNNPVVDGQLAQGDTRSLPDGAYDLRLTVYDRSGNAPQDQVQIRIENNQPDTPTPRPSPTPQPTEVTPPTETPAPSGNGPGTYQDNNKAIDYSGGWQTRQVAGASGGSIRQSNDAGATATLQISGASSFSVTIFGGPNRGVIRVMIDGSTVDNIDGEVNNPHDITGGPYALPDKGVHVITIVVVGGKGGGALDYITVNP